MVLQLEPACLRNAALALLDLGVEEFLDAAAIHANQMVMVLAFVELEHRLAGLEVVARQDAGRNLAVLVEAAVRNTILQLRGIDTYQEFIERHQKAMLKPEN